MRRYVNGRSRARIFFVLLACLIPPQAALAVVVRPIEKLGDPKIEALRLSFRGIVVPSPKDPAPIPPPSKREPKGYARAAEFDAEPSETAEEIAKALLLARMPAERMEWKDAQNVAATPESVRALTTHLWASYGYDPALYAEAGAFKRLYPRLMEASEAGRGVILVAARFLYDRLPHYAVVVIDSKRVEAYAMVTSSRAKPPVDPTPTPTPTN